MDKLILPTTARYTNDMQQPIYWIEGAAHGTRRQEDLRLLVIHHTAGFDSRSYLWRNRLSSSTTYLVGKYADAGVRIYKYMSEATDAPYTQGFASISTLDTAAEVNRAAIAIEIEGPPITVDVMTEAAKLAASIIRHWSARGIDLLLVGHKHIDARKVDPAFDWSDFCKMVYSRV